MSATAEAGDFTVINLNNSGPGSLRAATGLADNSNSPIVDRILFSSGLSGTITLTTGQLYPVDEPLQILGPGAHRLTVSGNGASRILYVDIPGADDDVTVSGLTLTAGIVALGDGGAIFSQGADLAIRDATISGSSASNGGGIFQYGGTLTIERSTISGNGASLGAGIRARGSTLTVSDSTISGNIGGNGIAIRDTSTTIEGSTIAGNAGNGIYTFMTDDPSVTSTIVADNTSDDLGGDATFNLAFSLVESNQAAINQTGPNDFGADPQLGALANNGGTTATQALSPTSPALDRGLDTGADQRGLPRAVDFLGAPNWLADAGGNAADMGAFELQGPLCKGRRGTRIAPGGVAMGTAGADVIVGAPRRDVIRSLGGNDLVCAGRGNDKVSGGGGSDRLFGEAGGDTLRGQGGKDTLVGAAGNDTLRGGPARDKLKGGPGRDTQRQ
jgi:hypothetical protein